PPSSGGSSRQSDQGPASSPARKSAPRSFGDPSSPKGDSSVSPRDSRGRSDESSPRSEKSDRFGQKTDKINDAGKNTDRKTDDSIKTKDQPIQSGGKNSQSEKNAQADKSVESGKSTPAGGKKALTTDQKSGPDLKKGSTDQSGQPRENT